MNPAQPLISDEEYFNINDILKKGIVTDEKFMEIVVQLSELMFQLRHDLISFREEMKENFKSIDFKRVKKNRTGDNRCHFLNKRGENCQGYICKVIGSNLCYAHHILASAPKDSRERAIFYSKHE